VAYALVWYDVPATNPVKLLVKAPIPDPSVVLESDIVGLTQVLQHKPLEVTKDPPSAVTFPPLLADISVIAVTGAVVTDANFRWIKSHCNLLNSSRKKVK
jgi:hypothetical protein